MNRRRISAVAALVLLGTGVSPDAAAADKSPWTQWRGPNRDGTVSGLPWPPSLGSNHLQLHWRAPAGPGYSGPVAAEGRVFLAESPDKSTERVRALDQETGRELWAASWEGYVKVPFFAKANGDWIRSTPTLDGDRLFVAGMRDVLVCLEAATGRELWRVDFVKHHGKPVPAFGFVSSPLVVEDAVYVQAGAGFARLDKLTGRILWSTLEDGGGMGGSAFSSPVLASLRGTSQLVVQTREKLAGVAPADGQVLWEKPIAAFRGMNILTPVVMGNRIFTSAYGGEAHLFEIGHVDDRFVPQEVWTARAEAYMSTPVVIGQHAYLHLRNQRFTCLDLATGRTRWVTEEKFGKYWSLVAQGGQILALDERGVLYLLRASPDRFEQLDQRKVAEHESWAHLAVVDRQILIRDLEGLTAYRWLPDPTPSPESGQSVRQPPVDR